MIIVIICKEEKVKLKAAKIRVKLRVHTSLSMFADAGRLAIPAAILVLPMHYIFAAIFNFAPFSIEYHIFISVNVFPGVHYRQMRIYLFAFINSSIEFFHLFASICVCKKFCG